MSTNIRFPAFTLSALRARYAEGDAPSAVLQEIAQHIAERGDDAVWIYRPTVEELEATAPTDASLPLYGVPFAVKDNIDVAGWPTTAGCPQYSYIAEADAPVVARLRAAGAIPIGKTNMDQFATGLVGVRSPHGAPRSVFDDRYISGGSSSGSAVAVAAGLVAFSLGTDTAGSGRVPAAFNNIVGLKPTRGLLSTRGVVPACRSLDCVSIFANTVADADAILAIAAGYDEQDPFSRAAIPEGAGRSRVRIGVPRPAQLEFFGDDDAAGLYRAAAEKFDALGHELVEVDFAPFAEAARLLYSGPWVAERLAAIQPFLEGQAEAIDPTVRGIISGGTRYSAVDAYRAEYELRRLQRLAAAEWQRMDALLLPTTGTIYTVAEVLADPVKLNTNLGYYTNFVNLLDLCGIAIPAGFRSGNGLPFGASLLAPAFQETLVSKLAREFLGEEPAPPADGGYIQLAVVGAHLTGQPLNHQLTDRNATFLRATRTAPGYRLYALAGTTPPKPGLVRDPAFAGPGIELEIWSLTPTAFGDFVAQVPPPMVIGSLELADGSRCKSFLCEPFALQGSSDITEFGGWRVFLRSKELRS